MKIAIATFATRVSPRFDCAQSVLVITIDEGEPPQRQQLAVGQWAPHERIDRLLELDVDTVICGGIDRWSVASLQSAGVTIYGWVTGEVEDALAAFLRGDLGAEAAKGGNGRCACRRFPGDKGAGTGPPGPGQGARGRGGSGGGRRHGRGRPAGA